MSPERAEQKILGQCLRNLRERQGLFQSDVAERLSMSTQAWQKYEAGERRFAREKLTKILEALQVTEQELELERARVLNGTTSPRVTVLHPRAPDRLIIDVYGRARAGAQGVQVYDVGEPLRTLDLGALFGPRTSAVEVAGDSMVDWAEPGEVVIFDRDRYPRRGYGCVLETNSGEYYVKLYERSDGSSIFVKELYPEERILTFALSAMKGVYAVVLRGG